MKHPEKQNVPPEEDLIRAVELAWLKENHRALHAIARDHYHAQYGRGAVVIDGPYDLLGEDTPFHYASQDQIEKQEDEVSRRLATLVADYDPAAEFVAVFIRSGIKFEFSMYHIRVEENSLEAEYAPNREPQTSRIQYELSQLNQLLGESGQIIDEDIEQAKRRLNGNGGFKRNF
ncbi:MAG: hypothetical protein AB1649_34570 [Chloroflexota bacterium]